MKIVLAVGSGALGGTELQLAETAKHLIGQGHEVAVLLVFQGGPLLEILSRHRIPHRVLGLTRRQSPTSWIRKLNSARGLLKTWNVDVWHVFLPEATQVLVPVLKAARVRGAIVVGIRGTPQGLGIPQRVALGATMRSADAITANAQHLIEDACQELRLPERLFHLVPNGLDIPSRVTIPRRELKSALTVANFHVYKGYETLVRAISEISREDIQYVFLGDGETRPFINDLAESLKVKHMIRFAGFAESLEFYSHADVLIHPSQYEGRSNAVLEAMAHGIPVIAADAPGNRELIIDGRSGLLFPRRDPRALAGSIAQLAESWELRCELAHGGFAVARQHSWSAVVESLVRIYEQVHHFRTPA